MSKDGKNRVYEIAREVGLKPQRLIEIMEELGIKNKGNLSIIDDETTKVIKEYIKELRDKKKEDETRSRKIAGNITIKEFADRFGIPLTEIRERIMKLGLPYKPTRRLSRDEVHYLAAELGLDVPEFENAEFLKSFVKRAPVVTVMGHVDHGKTTLLDAIRKTSVALKEKGQITQTIGASTVKIDGDEIIFIDTPGHEAFTEMRLRGSIVTDIVVLVVAADEGVKEQTIESLNHARAAKVPIIVAINKIDKPGADPERVKQQLADRGLLPEEWGGSTTYVPVSAKTGSGLQDLLEIIRLQSEFLNIRTDVNTVASGTIIESRIDKNIGPLATAIVQTGTLRVGDYIRVGNIVGRVRFMFDTFGKRLSAIKAISAVEIGGLPDIPEAGEIFYQLESAEEAKEETKLIEGTLKSKITETNVPKTLEELLKGLESRKEKKLYMVIKTDTHGSLEAVKKAVKEIKSNIPMEIIHEGVGGIVKSDVLLASATEGFILGFNVRATAEAKQEAKQRGIEIKTYDIIFELVEELTKLLQGMVVKEKKEVVLGKALVKETFKISDVGVIAGSLVTEGRIVRNAKAKVIRDNAVIYNTEIASLKRFKEDVREVMKGYECGIGLKNFNDIKAGDEIEVYSSTEEEQ